jgi:D-ribulokinase
LGRFFLSTNRYKNILLYIYSFIYVHLGLEDLTNSKYESIGGDKIDIMGKSIGNGLTERAANEMGLLKNTPVAIGIIDAHAGGIGVVY